MSRITSTERAVAVQRVLDGEPQLDVATSYNVPGATLRTWLHRAKSRKEYEKKKATSARDVETAASADPVAGLTRLARLYEQLKGVDADIKQSRDLEKVSPLAGLQALRTRVVLQICDIEEAAEVERKRRDLTRNQRQLVDGVILKLVQMPSPELEAILAGVALRRTQKGIGESTQNRTP